MTDWLLSGDAENWEKSIAKSIWGVKERFKGSWDRLAKGDLLFFYATSPVKGIVGIGKATTKFKQDKPLWKEEIDASKAIWTYRFEFTTLYVLLRPDWNKRSIKLSEVSMAPSRAMAGITQLHSNSETVAISEMVNEKWAFSLELIRSRMSLTPEKEIKEAESIAKGQGYRSSPRERRRIEEIAMNRAKQHFTSKGYVVEDVHATRPYDLKCRMGSEELFIEVKGTTGSGKKVLLTSGEVNFARRYSSNMALFVVHSISLRKKHDMTNGTKRVVIPWKIDNENLTPWNFFMKFKAYD